MTITKFSFTLYVWSDQQIAYTEESLNVIELEIGLISHWSNLTSSLKISNWLCFSLACYLLSPYGIAQLMKCLVDKACEIIKKVLPSV